MNINRTIILSIAIFNILVITDCNPFSTEKPITGNYYLWGDASLNETISYLKTDNNYVIIKDNISAVGYNNDFIIVRQNDPKKVKREYLSFYIIPLRNKIFDYPPKNLYGPMTEKDYWKKRWLLKVPKDLKFTIFP